MFQIHFHLKSEPKFNIECCKSTFNQKVKVKFHLWHFWWPVLHVKDFVRWVTLISLFWWRVRYASNLFSPDFLLESESEIPSLAFLMTCTPCQGLCQMSCIGRRLIDWGVEIVMTTASNDIEERFKRLF